MGSESERWTRLNDLLDTKKFSHEVVTDVSVDCSLDEFFEKFLADDAPYSQKTHHISSGDKKVEVTNWESKGDFESTRLITYDVAVPLYIAAVSGSGKAEKKQTLTKIPGHGICILTQTKILGLPMTDCFYVEDCILVKSLPNGGIQLSIKFQTHFVKFTMFKGMIKNGNIKEYTGFHTKYVTYVKTSLDEK
mmetsp:Transcript_30108/g.35007  ORF Transcript_30108/g.35007 Transcript_30108/m.35007 type:complete len:192 (+) Transcript_30108:64-639(+)